MGWLSDNVSGGNWAKTAAGGVMGTTLLNGLKGITGSNPTPPTVPDYVGAANATAAGNLANANTATQANRVNQNGINGNVQWTNSGTAANPHWTQNTSLNPMMQGLYNQGAGFDVNKAPAAPINPGQTAQDAIMARLAPQQQREQNSLNTNLANQGIGIGSEAYNTAQTQQGQRVNDANSQAALQGIGLDTQARQNQLNEQMMPITAMEGLNQGSNINNPAVPQQNYTAGADLTGANNAIYGGLMNNYNAAVGSKNSMQNGLFTLAGAGISAFSDVRLKRNIERIGTHILGIGIYAFEYIWGEKSIGVMAQEVLQVKPSAVSIHPSGYYMVNYGAL